MAVLLATGITVASSADFTLLATDNTSLFLVSTGVLPSGANIQIDVKGSNGLYYPFGNLDLKTPYLALASPGTFRVVRNVPGIDVGVDRV